MTSPEQHEALTRSLSAAGMRYTPQRELVYDCLMEHRDHPSAEDIHSRARSRQPSISLATVYNCLDSLVACGLVRQVNHERAPTRYCPNLLPHAHFHDARTGRVYDIDLPAEVVERVRSILPSGFEVSAVEIAFHGNTSTATTPDLPDPPPQTLASISHAPASPNSG